ncbi:MAG: NAD(P)/FAD-dependent oxidoreductase, partial [Candidatus Aenigmatarchaeota archaeon]
MRDVIIVGAGPGGSAAAKVLAEKGLDVALYEKRQEIGAPKRCAEGISLDMLELLGIKPPKNCFRQGIDGARVYAPNGKYLEAGFSKNAGYICERKIFDKWLAEEAARAGAYIRAGTPITEVIKENRKVCGVKGKFFGEPFEERCKILIAADGIESKIARMAGLNTTCDPHLTDSGFQYEMVGIGMDDPHKLHIFFGNEIAPRGYVWIFPKGRDVAN